MIIIVNGILIKHACLGIFSDYPKKKKKNVQRKQTNGKLNNKSNNQCIEYSNNSSFIKVDKFRAQKATQQELIKHTRASQLKKGHVGFGLPLEQGDYIRYTSNTSNTLAISHHRYLR